MNNIVKFKLWHRITTDEQFYYSETNNEIVFWYETSGDKSKEREYWEDKSTEEVIRS